MLPKSLRPLVPYLKRHRSGLFWGGLCVLFNNGVWILFPQVLRRAINDLHSGVTRQKLPPSAFLPLPFASVVIQYFGRRIHERFERIQAMFSDISARAQENFSGARVIRAYVQEQAEIAAFEPANKEYIRRSLGLVRLMGMLWPTLELMLGIAVVIVLWLGGNL